MICISLEDGGSFNVQKALLCEASNYFVEALNGRFVESVSKTLRLPGCDTQTFKLFLFWICKQTLPGHADSARWSRSYEVIGVYLVQMVRLWALGEMLMMPKMQNAAMQQLLEAMNDGGDLFSEYRLATAEALEVASLESPIVAIFFQELLFDFTKGWLHDEQLENFTRFPGFTVKFCAALRDSLNTGTRPKPLCTGGSTEKFMKAVD